jgi:hypothetical protein
MDLEDIKRDIGVPFVVYEAEMDRQERRFRRLIWIVVALIAAIVIMNAAWLYAWMQYDYVSYEAVTDAGGDANVIGNDGDIYNGYSETQETDSEIRDGQGNENP